MAEVIQITRVSMAKSKETLKVWNFWLFELGLPKNTIMLTMELLNSDQFKKDNLEI